MNTGLRAALVIAGTALLATPAEAAITVVGDGPARLCYEAADTGASPFDYMMYCNMALAGALSPGDRAATFVNRGVLKLAMKAHDAAAEDFHAGLALNDRLGEAYVDLGAVLIAKRNFAEAIALITKGLALGTKQPENAYYDRAVAYEAVGNIQGAYDDYRQAVTLKPDFTRASEELKRFRVVEKPSGT